MSSFRQKFALFVGRPRNPDANQLRTALQDEYKEYAEDKAAHSKVTAAALKTSLKALKAIQSSLTDVPEKAQRIDVHLTGMPLGAPGEVVLGRALLRCKILRSLHLDGCGLTPESLQALAPLLTHLVATLETLNLSNNPIRAAGLHTLSHALALNRSVQELILINTEIDDAGAEDLANALETTKISRTVDLRRNPLLTGASAVRLLRTLHTTVFVTSVVLDDALLAADMALQGQWLAVSMRNKEIAGVLEELLLQSCQRTFKKRLGSFRRAIKSQSSADGKGPVYKWVSNQTLDLATTLSKRFDAASTLDVGRRHEMQDIVCMKGCFQDNERRDFFALFDGHGGRKAASYCASRIHLILDESLHPEAGVPRAPRSPLSPRSPTPIVPTDDPSRALTDAFEMCAREMRTWATVTGTTAVALLLIGDLRYIAHVGDSRTVLAQNGKVAFATRDHKATDPAESERILKLGGVIQNDRVGGQLSVTRALGDSNLAPFVMPTPEVAVQTISKDDDFVVMASDGVWDVMSNEDVVSLVCDCLAASRQKSPSTSHAQVACDLVVAEALKRGSNDNISVVIVCFDERQARAASAPPQMRRRTSSSSLAGRRAPITKKDSDMRPISELDSAFMASDSELDVRPSRLLDADIAAGDDDDDHDDDDHDGPSSVRTRVASNPASSSLPVFAETRQPHTLARLLQARISGFFDDVDLENCRAVAESLPDGPA